MDIHSPNIVGPLAASADEGVAGQVLTSQGPGVQVGWATPNDNSFTFTSALALNHSITHNLNNSFPSLTVWETDDMVVVIPDSIISDGANGLTISFFIPRAIAGTIVG